MFKLTSTWPTERPASSQVHPDDRPGAHDEIYVDAGAARVQSALPA